MENASGESNPMAYPHSQPASTAKDSQAVVIIAGNKPSGSKKPTTSSKATSSSAKGRSGSKSSKKPTQKPKPAVKKETQVIAKKPDAAD